MFKCERAAEESRTGRRKATSFTQLWLSAHYSPQEVLKEDAAHSDASNHLHRPNWRPGQKVLHSKQKVLKSWRKAV